LTRALLWRSQDESALCRKQPTIVAVDEADALQTLCARILTTECPVDAKMDTSTFLKIPDPSPVKNARRSLTGARTTLARQMQRARQLIPVTLASAKQASKMSICPIQAVSVSQS